MRRRVAASRGVAAALGAIATVLLLAPAVLADHHPAVDERVEGRSVYDGGLLGATSQAIETIADAMTTLHGVDLIVFARTLDEPPPVTTAEAESVVQAAVDDWSLKRAVVMAVVARSDGCDGGAAISTVGALTGATLDRVAIIRDRMQPALARCDPATAAVDASVAIVQGLTEVNPSDADAGGTAPAGPPFPEPDVFRAVYDNARVFSAETIASAEATIDAIEARTGAEVVVYSQVVDYGVTLDEANDHAQALIDQWGIGRKGFDDGLVILFDLDPSREHGQVSLYGADGYRAAYLDNTEKQKVFDEDMLPKLRDGDLDGALLVALERVDANATPEHAARLQTARQVDSAAGLLGAPAILFGLVGTALFAWMRYGRDPVYLDDPSIHMAGPPEGLTPAAATFVLAGRSTRRALTTAMLDLASRGLIAFREETALLGLKRKVGVVIHPPEPDAETAARQARNAARPLGPAEALAFRYLDVLEKDVEGFIEPKELLNLGTKVGRFDKELEEQVVGRGWFREPPSKVRTRWAARGTIAFVAGIVALVIGGNLPSNGLLLIGAALLLSGGTVAVMSRWMESVSLPGAMIRAMLAAYRRTLSKTMDQARSMNQVVEESSLIWLETPDQAVVWGTALGLEHEIERVLSRSLDDVRDGRAAPSGTYLPAWYGTGSGTGAAAGDGGGGLFSSSGVPNFGGMMAALGTIGNSPSSSSGGSGGGGFGGGSSGGGGGGSGGGF